MKRPGRRTLLAAGLTAALALGSGVAYAAVSGGPVDGGGGIHGCYTNTALNGSHALVLQDAGTSCPKGTTAISWAVQGPQGPAGPTGPVGPTGPAGPTATVTVTATPTQTQTATAFPNNQVSSAVNLDTLDCTQSRTVTGDNLTGTSAWYEVNFDNANSLGVPSCSMQLNLASTDTDVIQTVETAASGPNLLASPASSFSESDSGIYFIQVTGGTSGAEFTLTAQAG